MNTAFPNLGHLPSREAIFGALHHLIDPEVGINIVDLGMLGDIRIGPDGGVVIEILPTTPGCPMHEVLANGAAFIVGGLPGVTSVKVTFIHEPAWTPDRITPEGRAALGMD